MKREKKWLVDLELKGKSQYAPKTIRCQLDSGSTCNVMTRRCYHKIQGNTPLDKSDVRIGFYDGSLKPTLGHEKEFVLEFQIIDGPMQPPLISAEACEQLQLVKRMFALDRNAYTKETKESLLEK